MHLPIVASVFGSGFPGSVVIDDSVRDCRGASIDDRLHVAVSTGDVCRVRAPATLAVLVLVDTAKTRG